MPLRAVTCRYGSLTGVVARGDGARNPTHLGVKQVWLVHQKGSLLLAKHPAKCGSRSCEPRVIAVVRGTCHKLRGQGYAE